MNILLTLYACSVVVNVCAVMALTSYILRGNSGHGVAVRCGCAAAFMLSGFVGWLAVAVAAVKQWHDNAVAEAAAALPDVGTASTAKLHRWARAIAAEQERREAAKQLQRQWK